MKVTWRKIVADFTRRERRIMSKHDFSHLLCCLCRSIKLEYAINGFRKTGIIPFNPGAVSNSAVHPSEVFYNAKPQEQGAMEPEELGGMDRHAMEHPEESEIEHQQQTEGRNNECNNHGPT